jgi:hypothetical protein
MNLKRNISARWSESSFHGVTIATTPAKLIKIAEEHGLEYEDYNDGHDKTNFNFTFELEDDTYFTVYDWKEYRPLNRNEGVLFHIGGATKLDSLKGKEVLKMLL